MMARDFNRYIVLKSADVFSSLTSEEFRILQVLADKVNCYHAVRKGRDFKCVVVEDDWPEYEGVWNMIDCRDFESV